MKILREEEIKGLIIKKEGTQVEFCGVVQSVRRTKAVDFLILCLGKEVYQLVGQGIPREIHIGASVFGKGILKEAKLTNVWLSERCFEIQISQIEVTSSPEGEADIDWSKKELKVSGETLLNSRPITLRHEKQKAIFYIQNSIVRGFRQGLEEIGFTEIRSPKLCAQGAEGGANVFQVQYFERLAYLAQSPQFYKEFGTGIFQRVFEIGPVFRAEKHNSNRHLNEYISMDLEMGPIASFEEIMKLEFWLLKKIFKRIEIENQRELEILGVQLPSIEGSCPVVTFKEAKEILRGLGIDNPESDLNPEEESVLGNYFEERTKSPFLFVTHYPLSVRPFYTLGNKEGESYSFDLLFKGMEITTGGQRIHDFSALEFAMKEKGLNPEEYKFFSQAHRNGLPPHGGFGLGLERLTSLILGLTNVKACTLFPRDRTRLTP